MKVTTKQPYLSYPYYHGLFHTKELVIITYYKSSYVAGRIRLYSTPMMRVKMCDSDQSYQPTNKRYGRFSTTAHHSYSDETGNTVTHI